MPKPSACRSCGRPIYWTTTENGKKMPVDVAKTEAGTFRLARDPDGDLLSIHQGFRLAGGYQSHFATCPHADQHRRG